MEACKQGLIEARLNSGHITDSQGYVQKLLDTQYELKVAESLLHENLSKVVFLEEKLVIIKA